MLIWMHKIKVSNFACKVFHNPFSLSVFTVSLGTYTCTLCPSSLWLCLCHISGVSLFLIQVKAIWVSSFSTPFFLCLKLPSYSLPNSFPQLLLSHYVKFYLSAESVTVSDLLFFSLHLVHKSLGKC